MVVGRETMMTSTPCEERDIATHAVCNSTMQSPGLRCQQTSHRAIRVSEQPARFPAPDGTADSVSGPASSLAGRSPLSASRLDQSQAQMETSETTALLGHAQERDVLTQVYKRRWYVLTVFSLAALVQGLGWATWGPITQTSKLVFSWTDADVALQPLWGNVAATITMFPVTWLMDVKGLRVSMIFSAIALSLGFAVRCVTSDPALASRLINVGQVLIGVGGTVPFSGVTLLAATWFPTNQRATATAISSVFSYIGVAVSFIIGPELVPDAPNSTYIGCTHSDSNLTNYTDCVDVTVQRDAVMRLLYYEAALTGLLLLLVLVYFPARPPLPPCRSAAFTRTEYSKGVRALFRNVNFWILAFAYCVPVGTYGAFGDIMDIALNPIGISQITAGWMGFYATIGGCLAGLLASRLADVFMRRLKLLLLLLYMGAVGSLVWFCLLVLQYIAYSLSGVYVTSILIGVCINGAIPLFYEAVCEATYPVAEGVSTGVVTILNNLVGVVFFALLFLPGIGVQWMDWAMLGTTVVAVPLLLCLRQHYTRIDIDTISISVPPHPDHSPPQGLGGGDGRA